ncbi:MAG TPA: ATP-binding cassette domain-containing protein, partial [Euzebyales bacterium]|nr:ATP-binding cassette domain-containing protein [Euzebyales bacterium]
AVMPGTAPPAPDPSVVVDHLSVTYKVQLDRRRELRRVLVGDQTRRARHRLVEAVRDVSFIARPGESIGVIGHNGSGKSTLLRTIAGLQPASGGRVFASAFPVLLGVTAALEPDVSGRSNVYLGGTAMGYSRAEMDERVDEIIETAGLTDFADMPLRTYSSGMKARLSFTIATYHTPEILLIDESLGVGDEEFREQSDERIRQMLDESGTVFVVSHKADAILSLCTRVLWLHHGQLVADGDPAAIMKDYKQLMKLRRQERRRGGPRKGAPGKRRKRRGRRRAQE